MELLQLRYFCDAAHNENFSITAKKFGVPTSAVSQSIRRLEKEIGASFFTRKANSIKLNDIGKEFFLKISSSLALMDDAIASVSDSSKKRMLNVCIHASHFRTLKAIEEFKSSHTDIDVIIERNFDLANNDFDIIVTDKNLKLPEFEKRLILSEGFVIAINKSNPLSSCEKITLDMLKNEPFITLTEKRPMYKTVMSLCADFGFTPHITLQTDDPNYIRHLVSLSMGVAIIPESHTHETFSKKVVLYPIEGYTREIYAYILQSKLVLPYVDDFLKLLKEI